MDILAIQFCRDHPVVMEAFDALADQYGQNLEAAYVPELAEEFGIPHETLLVRYQGGEPLAAIAVDGSTLILDEDDD